MTTEELIERKRAKREELAREIEAMRKQADALEVAIRRAEGRYLEVEEDLGVLEEEEGQ